MNEKECFVIGAWPNTKPKEHNLFNLIKELKSKDYPVCLVTHYPVSKEIQEICDYFIYEKNNILSTNWRLTFWRMVDGKKQERPSKVAYHGVACLMNIRNAIDLFLAKSDYKYIHYIESDVTYDFNEYINTFNHNVKVLNKKALFVHFQDNQYRTDLFSVDIRWYDEMIPRVQSWDEYANTPNSGNLILEYWFTHQVKTKNDLYMDEVVFINDIKVGNKWTQATEVDWEEDSRPKLDFENAPSIMFSSERKECFIKALESLYNLQKGNPQIVEVGVTRNLGNRSDGDSTSIWAWYISKYGGSYHGCDISPDSISVAKQALSQYITGDDRSSNVALTTKDGLEFLKYYNKPIDLLYLDSIDWVKGSYEAGLFHLKLLLEGMNKVNVGGFIMFDDTFNVETFDGKAEIAIPYLLGGNNFTCIHRGYQFIFRRDI